MDIYREEILEHWRNPQNFGEMAGADVVIDQINPLCGDQVTFFFKLKNGKIEKVSFIGLGCAISIASASILSDFIKGKSIGDLSQITGKRVLDLIGGGITPARLKCAFLSLEVVRKLNAENLTTKAD